MSEGVDSNKIRLSKMLDFVGRGRLGLTSRGNLRLSTARTGASTRAFQIAPFAVGGSTPRLT